MKHIAILSVPRSGSTWLGQIFNSSPEVLYRFQPNFAYSFPYSLKEDSNGEDIYDFYRKLKACDDPFVTGQLSISGKENLQFRKSHMYSTLVWKEVHYLFLAKTLMKNSDTIIIGLIRSPLSVIASWIKIPKEFDPSWNVEEEWKKASLKNKNNEINYFGYAKWKVVMAMFEELQMNYPERFYLLNYENLLLNTLEKINDVFKFCDLNMHHQVVDFIQKSSSVDEIDAYSVFKNKKKDDSWKQDLPNCVVEEILSDPDFIKYNKKYHWI